MGNFVWVFKVGRGAVAGLGCLLLACSAGPCHASATVEKQTGFLAVTEENDSLSNPWGTHQDRHYTQGIKISLFGGDDFLTNVTGTLDRILPAWGFRPEAGDLGWIIVGQNIYTPTSLTNPAPIRADRPYAGWLYTGGVYQRRGELAPNLAVMENFEVNLGIVGPESMAAKAQLNFHHWVARDDIPRGWAHQLKDEPGVVLKYARLWRYSLTTNTAHYVDLIPHVGGDLGNVFTFATAGATVRLGGDLPSDFGVQTIDSPAAVNGGFTHATPGCFAYLFGSVDGRAVGHDITLDGNSFSSGPNVNKNILVGDLTWGVALQFWHHLEITYQHTTRTEEFRGQDGNDVFGSLTLKGKFYF